VNAHPEILIRLLLEQLPDARSIEWLSPLASDDMAEYRDAAFLDRIGLPNLTAALRDFWPERGPQWDGLARTGSGELILVEAKAHIREIMSSGCTASSERSRQMIESSLGETAAALRANPSIPWTGPLYQTANRIAHLYFFSLHKVPARLAFVCFVGDEAMGGPRSAEEWRGALHMAEGLLGLRSGHRLADRILHVFPDVSMLS
jgi:hypothetical protein